MHTTAPTPAPRSIDELQIAQNLGAIPKRKQAPYADLDLPLPHNEESFKKNKQEETIYSEINQENNKAQVAKLISEFNSKSSSSSKPLYSTVNKNLQKSVSGTSLNLEQQLQEDDPIYETIPRSNSTGTIFSEPWNSSDMDPLEVLTTTQVPPKKPLRSHDSTSSDPPSYRSGSNASSTTLKSSSTNLEPNMSLLLKSKAKLGYPLQQRAFIIPATALVTFIAAYTALIYSKYPGKFLENITNIKNPSIYIPMIIASVLAFSSIVAFILNFKYTRVKTPATQGDDGIFSAMKKLDHEKCIRSITLEYSNNTNVTLLDKSKYKTLIFKEVGLTLKRPIINVEMTALITLASTYLLTKCFEMGPKDLANSLEHFNTGSTELMAFTIATCIIAALFIYSFVHHYKKTYVEGLELNTDPRKIVSYNKEYIGKAELCHNDKKILSSGKHSEGKAASLTIDQAKVDHYNGKTVVMSAIAG